MADKFQAFLSVLLINYININSIDANSTQQGYISGKSSLFGFRRRGQGSRRDYYHHLPDVDSSTFGLVYFDNTFLIKGALITSSRLLISSWSANSFTSTLASSPHLITRFKVYVTCFQPQTHASMTNVYSVENEVKTVNDFPNLAVLKVSSSIQHKFLQ